MVFRVSRAALIVALIGGVVIASAGCGRKAAPDHPPGSDYPRTYPAR